MTAPVPEEQDARPLPSDLEPPGEHDDTLPGPDDAEQNPVQAAEQERDATTDGEPSQ
ncbi:hypothetical protein K8Z61_08970 [Nocardioides sp. TRM66260-LWL]|uniref:hypothetical protein n=1 Tax=Nocardioides sp. TRM66260-LWL TaxID=2874478 RepID=UPI001CC735C4|nr:hypothetical protein [Nocardioides sp. TRM66260-LWL]MBZ5734629.1 hypothetical protein [Nocardioides sp. TRM66260-LWL]